MPAAPAGGRAGSDRWLRAGRRGGPGRSRAASRSSVNPRQVRDFAKATGKLAKTEVLDAQVLAHFAEAVHPEPRPLTDEATPAAWRRCWNGAANWWRCSTAEKHRRQQALDKRSSAHRGPYRLARTGPEPAHPGLGPDAARQPRQARARGFLASECSRRRPDPRADRAC